MKKWIYAVAAALMFLCSGQAEDILHNWEPHDGFGGIEIETAGEYIYALEYGESAWGHEPPYRTTVFDLEENKIFTVDASFARYYDWNMNTYRFGLEDGFGVVEFGDGSRGIISDRGEILIDGLKSAGGFIGDYAYYSREFDIPILNKIARKLDVQVGVCGRIDKNGKRLEMIGGNLSAPDSEGYMLLQTVGEANVWQENNRFAYVDSEGNAAIQKVFQDAHGFVDGSAAVKYNGKYMLIDPKGKRICDLSRKWANEMAVPAAFECKLLVADKGEAMVLIDRSGKPVNDIPCKWIGADLIAFMGREIWICEGLDGMTRFADASGTELFAIEMENWIFRSEDPDFLWIQSDGLWGRVDVTGIHGAPGQYTSEDRFVEIEGNMGRLPDGKWVAIGENGEALWK